MTSNDFSFLPLLLGGAAMTIRWFQAELTELVNW